MKWLDAIALAVVAPDSARIRTRAFVFVLPWFRTLLACRINAFAFVTKDTFAGQVVVASFLNLLTGRLLGAFPLKKLRTFALR